MKDFYYILGLESNCTLFEVKEAYRKLSKKFHPDLNQGDKYLTDRFMEVQEAYETLSDGNKRREYDKELILFETRQSTQQTQRKYYKTKHSAGYMAKRKGPGVGVSITLIVLGIIVAIYVGKSFIHSKPTKVYSVAAENTAPVTTKKHHIKGHIIKHKKADDSAQAQSDSASNSVVQHIVSDFKHSAKEKTKVPTEKNTAATTDNKALNPPEKKNDGNTDYLYATYTRANATGVINMRQSDSYSAVVLETLPANAKVLVLERGSIYYRVFYDKQIGYIPKWSLREK